MWNKRKPQLFSKNTGDSGFGRGPISSLEVEGAYFLQYRGAYVRCLGRTYALVIRLVRWISIIFKKIW